VGSAVTGVTISSSGTVDQVVDAVRVALQPMGGVVSRTPTGLYITGGAAGVNFAFTAKTTAQVDVRQVAQERFEVTCSIAWSPAAVVWICLVVGFFIFGILWLVGLFYLFYNPTQAYQLALSRLGSAQNMPYSPSPQFAAPGPSAPSQVAGRPAYPAPATMMAPAGAVGAVAGPTVHVSLNGRPLTALPLSPGSRYTIGRASGSGITLADPMVSGTHAILTVHSNGDLGIADLGSANGTFVNGQAVAGELRPLRPGDDVLLGTSNCRLGFDFS
jgi:hypothetical protein